MEFTETVDELKKVFNNKFELIRKDINKSIFLDLYFFAKKCVVISGNYVWDCCIETDEKIHNSKGIVLPQSELLD